MAADPLDALFQVHDALSGNAATQGAVDLALVQGIVDLKPNQLDEEASVYAGVTTLVYLAEYAGSDAFQFVSDKQVAFATKNALHNIERGIKHWDTGEVQAAQEWLGHVAQAAHTTDVGTVLSSAGFELPHLHGHHADWQLG